MRLERDTKTKDVDQVEQFTGPGRDPVLSVNIVKVRGTTTSRAHLAVSEPFLNYAGPIDAVLPHSGGHRRNSSFADVECVVRPRVMDVIRHVVGCIRNRRHDARLVGLGQSGWGAGTASAAIGEAFTSCMQP